MEMTVGGTDTLVATVSPDDADDKSVQFSSSNESVVTVSETGELTGITAGTAQIEAKTVNNLVATCEITVAPSA